jgi:hypothetical protein
VNLLHNGYIRKDKFGRIILDECPSDEHHLKYAQAKEGDDRACCRIVLDDWIAENRFPKIHDELCNGMVSIDLYTETNYLEILIK